MTDQGLVLSKPDTTITTTYTTITTTYTHISNTHFTRTVPERGKKS